MSHATLTVALPGTLPREDIQDALSAVLDRYDENRETERYVRATKAELIAEGRAEIEHYKNGTYAEYLADPAVYAEKCRNDAHLAYVSGTAEGGGFPAKLAWTDEQVYADQIQWVDEESIGPEGEVYSTRNPDSKWDWWVIGGRWASYWPVLEKADIVPELTHDRNLEFVEMIERVRPGAAAADRKYVEDRAARPGTWVDVVRKMDIDFAHKDLYPATFAFLDSDGQWHEKGLMGWFGTSSDDKEQDVWRAQYNELVAKEADNAWFALVDYHI